jgi:type VI secretion system protein ImpK
MTSIAHVTSIEAVASVDGSARPSIKAVPSMKDLLEDGIYLLFLLRSKNSPMSCSEFNHRIDQYLATFDRVCRTFDKPLDAILEAKYAFCALLDEIVLSSGLPIRDEWESAPLQLRLFGEHLAGEGFFDRLERLRQDPTANIELLEIFHTCLLLGFQGKYLLEGTEKLNYLIARLGQEISAVRGPSKGFAPNWKIPFKIKEYVRHEIPLWLYYALLAVLGVAAFLAFHWFLDRAMQNFVQPTIPTSSEHHEMQDEAREPNGPAEAAPPAVPRLHPDQRAASQGNQDPDDRAQGVPIQESQLMHQAETELRREAESEAASLQGSARSKAHSAARSLIQ